MRKISGHTRNPLKHTHSVASYTRSSHFGSSQGNLVLHLQVVSRVVSRYGERDIPRGGGTRGRAARAGPRCFRRGREAPRRRPWEGCPGRPREAQRRKKGSNRSEFELRTYVERSGRRPAGRRVPRTQDPGPRAQPPARRPARPPDPLARPARPGPTPGPPRGSPPGSPPGVAGGPRVEVF